MSGDPKQHYFSEGMTTNICAQLSRIRTLKVKLGGNYDLSKSQPAEIAEGTWCQLFTKGVQCKKKTTGSRYLWSLPIVIQAKSNGLKFLIGVAVI